MLSIHSDSKRFILFSISRELYMLGSDICPAVFLHAAKLYNICDFIL